MLTASIVTLLVSSLLAVPGGGSCSPAATWIENCGISAGIDDDEVYLEAEQSEGVGSGVDVSEIAEQLCEAVVPGRDCFAVTGPVTIADIAAFRPASAGHGMQPGGWAVVGLPTNFYSSGSSSIDSGTLLSQAAEVRFTPVAWRWNYGDGTSLRSSSAGRPWTHADEFSPTSTTHVFAQRGRYTVTLVIDYRAEWRVAGGPWVPIVGILSVPAPPQQLSVIGARTVLVDEDCVANPAGPGC